MDDKHKIVAIRNLLNQPTFSSNALSRVVAIREIINDEVADIDRHDFKKLYQQLLGILLMLSVHKIVRFEVKATLRAIFLTMRETFAEDDWALMVAECHNIMSDKSSSIRRRFWERYNRIFEDIENSHFKRGENAETDRGK